MVVLLTARAIDGDWLVNILESVGSDAHVYWREDIALPDTLIEITKPDNDTS